ncbi:MAG: heme A synthase [Alphaproteobacteria bacterium]|nr:heme A synthase [Alphaproteobacteria bacterium]NCQ88715.1 heme A synthase [Alphaproteobacteria bacterium]NCT08187.1 heme A synthase [Alphaproteobacteria bacterium]
MPETIKNMTQKTNKAIANWLYFTAFMVFAMAIIGAITRLTESGLSMVEWQPITGTIPPLNEAQWQEEFNLYRASPEYQKKNFGMSLDEFKNIFFWEWFHRVWGRLIGLVYAVPFSYFLLTKKIPKGFKIKLFIGLLLGGCQGLMGWYMVQSGLIDRPSVSHFRLAAHLSLAALIFCYLLWLAFDLNGNKSDNLSFCIKRHGWIAFGFTFVTVVWGAFVAGLDAGLVYNTWPLMGDKLIPHELNSISSILFEPVSVQFTHRWIAIVTAVIVLSFAWRIKSKALAGMMALQVILGITTLLSMVAIPLAAAHQAGAFILLGLLVYWLHRLRRGTHAV